MSSTAEAVTEELTEITEQKTEQKGSETTGKTEQKQESKASKEDLEATIKDQDWRSDLPEDLRKTAERFASKADAVRAIESFRKRESQVRVPGKDATDDEKAAYRKEQRETVIKTVRGYNQQIPVVQNLDFGHTDPQVALPMGNMVRVDSLNQKISLTY